MTAYLDRDDVLTAGAAALGHVPDVRDFGLVEAAVARPRATVFGVDAYPTAVTKAAALLQSLARNHALVDGNKRTAWASAWVFLHINGVELGDFDVDDAEEFVYDVVSRDLDIDVIADRLALYSDSSR